MALIHQTLKEKLSCMISNNKIPHIIFHGPLGSGKRYLLDYFIKKIYKNNAEKIKQYVMYVDCAHGRGIRFIRDQLKFFAKTNIQNKKGLFFKSIVLFNAEKLTTDAQSALRRCIEQFSHTTRFFIVVKDKNKLLKPIQSRFCNIYVPRPTRDGVKINLHLGKSDVKKIKKRDDWLKTQLLDSKHFKSIDTCYHLACKLYEKGYHILDLFDIIENEHNIANKYFKLVYFDQIRREFRNEKLLLFQVLFFTFLRPNFDLENIEIM